MEEVRPTTGDHVSLGFSFALGHFSVAIDHGRLVAEANYDASGRIIVPDAGYPLHSGRRGMLSVIKGEPGPRQGNVVAIVVGDEEHYLNSPPGRKVRVHSGCSFSILGEKKSAELIDVVEREESLPIGERAIDFAKYAQRGNYPSPDCDCRMQGQQALEEIIDESGVLFDAHEQEARGHGLKTKMQIYALQRQGLNTAEACKQLGLEWDVRDYSHCVKALLAWGMDDITLLSNNPWKHKAFQDAGIKTNLAPHIHGVTRHNLSYLVVKASQGHLLDPEELSRLAADSDDPVTLE